MFTILRRSIGILILIFMLCVAPVLTAVAAPPPPPPDPPGSPGGGATYIGGAPIAGGMLILIALGAGYGARKLYNARKRKISE